MSRETEMTVGAEISMAFLSWSPCSRSPPSSPSRAEDQHQPPSSDGYHSTPRGTTS